MTAEGRRADDPGTQWLRAIEDRELRLRPIPRIYAADRVLSLESLNRWSLSVSGNSVVLSNLTGTGSITLDRRFAVAFSKPDILRLSCLLVMRERRWIARPLPARDQATPAKQKKRFPDP